MDWWLIVIVAAVVVIGTRVLRARAKAAEPASDRATGSPVDFAGNRETNRVAGLSDEDRSWESASQQRNRDSVARAESTTEPRP